MVCRGLKIIIKYWPPDLKGLGGIFIVERESIMTTYQILCLCSVSSISSAIIGALIQRLVSAKKENDALKKGLQALLRASMINDYNKWVSKGYAPIYARQNFQNVWDNYHNLGANGVMDDIKNKFLALPTPPDGVVN